MFPHDFRLLRSISDVLKMQEISKIFAQLIPPKIEASDILKRVELYWNAKSNFVNLIYYPYYVADLITQDGSRRIDIIDALNGKLKEL